MERRVAHKRLRVDGRLCYESNLEPRTLNRERLQPGKYFLGSARLNYLQRPFLLAHFNPLQFPSSHDFLKLLHILSIFSNS